MSAVIDRPQGEYTLVDSVAWLKADDGSSRLFDLERSSFGLNELATRMLDGILNGTIDGTVQDLGREFQVDQGTLRIDLADLVQRLERSGLIVQRDLASSKIGNKTGNLFHRLVGGMCGLIFGQVILRTSSIQTEASLSLFVLRVAHRVLSLSEVVAILDRFLPRNPPPVERSAAEGIVNEVESTLMSSVHGLPLETACKERALCGWFMLRRRRVAAELVVGVTLTPVTGHCWCQYGERIVADTIDRCCDFTVIWRH